MPNFNMRLGHLPQNYLSAFIKSSSGPLQDCVITGGVNVPITEFKKGFDRISS